MTTSKETATQTLLQLEERLRRVDYVLNGYSDHDTDQVTSDQQQKSSATARLRTLERSFQSLTARSPAVSNVLALQRRHPDLFHPASSADTPSTLPPSSLAALVLAHAQLYQTTSARLSQLQDANIPDPAVTAKLIELRPRIEQLQAKQETQLNEFAELRGRSAKAVESWYEGGVLAMGERWANWEERLRDVEILVRRREAAKRREEDMV